MSIHLQTTVWRADIDPTAKLVLLRLADFAADDGSRIFPSVTRIADDCGLSPRAVQSALRRLEAAGLLIMVAEADARLQRPRAYRIETAVLNAAARPSRDEEGVQEMRPPGEPNAPPPVQDVHPPGAGDAPLTTSITIIPVAAPRDPARSARPAPSAREVSTLGRRIAAVTGWDADPCWTGNYARLFPWLTAGWSPDADILPTIARLTADRTRRGQGPPRGLEYFESAIADAFAARTRPAPEGNPHAPHRRSASAPFRRYVSGGHFADILQQGLVGNA
jgi:DNA-binding transcriptional ArsR family regulator